MEKFTSLEHAQETYPAEAYLILSDNDADEMTAECIRESVWAFRPEFLASMTELPEQVFEVLGVQCENANDAVLTLIDRTCGLDEFVRQAVRFDGRGHFLAHYDHEENEIEIDGETFYLYRTN